MTIQELINQLQNAIDELGYRPDTHIVVETNKNVHEEETYWDFDLDYSDSDLENKNWKLAINVFADEEVNDENL